jgi:DNA replication ATP-dependent helicase Dna2
MRKSVLADRVKFPTDRTMALLNGSLSHELFQQCLIKNDFSSPYMESIIPALVHDHLGDLYAVGETESAAAIHLRESIPNYQTWAKTYLGNAPKVRSLIIITHMKPNANVIEHRGGKAPAKMAISSILDIEENIWSPMFGIKGKIDATVQSVHQDSRGHWKTLVTPLEVKTGKRQNVSHRAQTTLYNLLLSDRYGTSWRDDSN